MEEPVANMPGQVQVGKSGGVPAVWVVVLALLLVAAIGFAVWQVFSASQQVSGLISEKNDLQSTNNELRTEVDQLKGTDSSGDEATTDPDSFKILAAVDAHVRAPVGAKGTFEYAIQKTNGDFSRVSVSVEEGGGYLLWLKKVENSWTVLFGGQDMPSQEMIDKYGLTAAVLE